MWIAIYKALESFLVPKLVLSCTGERLKKKKKMKVYLAGCLAISSETALASQNGWLPFNNLVRDKKERALGLPIPCQFCLNRVASRGLSCPGGLKSS